MLRQRVLTALVLVAVAGGALFALSPAGFGAFVAIPLLLAMWEWSALAGLRNLPLRFVYVLAGAVLLGAVALFSGLGFGAPRDLPVRDVLGAGCLWWSLALLWVMSYPASAPLWRPRLLRALIGWLVLIPAWAALVYLRAQPSGIAWVLVVLGLVAAADIGAYFSGRAIGGAKLAPAVSPGKTWSGFWGGVVSVQVFLALVWFAGALPNIGLLPLLAAGAVTALASVLGDLLESMVKRERGVKDSGRMLPGHGGMLDRFDSICAAAPVLALAVLLLELA